MCLQTTVFMVRDTEALTPEGSGAWVSAGALESLLFFEDPQEGQRCKNCMRAQSLIYGVGGEMVLKGLGGASGSEELAQRQRRQHIGNNAFWKQSD